MDKSWMTKSRLSQEYVNGVEEFLNFAFDNSSQDNKIVCPYIKCVNAHWQTREMPFEHIACDGILQGYTWWFFHGDDVGPSTSSVINTFMAPSSSNPHNNNPMLPRNGMEELL